MACEWARAHKHTHARKHTHPDTPTYPHSLRREDGPLRTIAPPGSGQAVYRKAQRVACDAAAQVWMLRWVLI